jgi:hypothetical protein
MPRTLATERPATQAAYRTIQSRTIQRGTWPLRVTAWVVLLAILGATLPIRAEEEIRILTDVRAEVEARRHVRPRLGVELTDGTLVTGTVGAVRKNDFAIVTGLHVKQTVAYIKIHALVDTQTGQTVALVRQTPPASGAVSRPKKIAIIVLAAVGTVFLVAYIVASRVK